MLKTVRPPKGGADWHVGCLMLIIEHRSSAGKQARLNSLHKGAVSGKLYSKREKIPVFIFDIRRNITMGKRRKFPFTTPLQAVNYYAVIKPPRSL